MKNTLEKFKQYKEYIDSILVKIIHKTLGLSPTDKHSFSLGHWFINNNGGINVTYFINGSTKNATILNSFILNEEELPTTIYRIECEWEMPYACGYYSTKEAAQKAIDEEDWETYVGYTLEEVKEGNYATIEEIAIFN